MTNAIKKLLKGGVTTVLRAEDKSFRVEVSADGALRIDPRKLAMSDVGKRHIRAISSIRKEIERRKK